MGLQITIDDAFKEAELELKSIRQKLLPRATRQAINKTIVSMRKATNQEIREDRKLTQGTLNKQFLRMVRARGNDISKLGAQVQVSGNPISARHFLKGTKNPSRPKRKGFGKFSGRALKFEVQPGKQTILRKAFYETGKGKNAQVFQRQGKARLPLVKRVILPLSITILKPEHLTDVQKVAIQRFPIEFQRAYDNAIRNLGRFRGKK